MSENEVWRRSLCISNHFPEDFDKPSTKPIIYQ